MTLSRCRVVSNSTAGADISVVRFSSPELASTIQPGQFLNIRVSDGTDPLLRRPFSAYRVEHDEIEIIFSVIGRGTRLLAGKRAGDALDVLGPLGVPFAVAGREFDRALLVAGGLGVAPLPILTQALRREGKQISTFLGARTRAGLVTNHLDNIKLATDDGSEGFHGTIVDLLRKTLKGAGVPRAKMFACGPSAMLRGVAAVAKEFDVPCEVSLEGNMACGFGICQGCPVELTDGPSRYALMCKDGPVFDVRRIML
jgi:dihydroorotate dehydrogenase electron transfer subunit